ncbi:MAG: serine/threonine-protein kinase [Myxococcota bacterium]
MTGIASVDRVGEASMATWRKGRLIDEGGFGKVYEATCLDNGQLGAWKEMDLSKATPVRVRRFEREIRIHLGLQHTNIVPVLGYNITAKPPFFVMGLAKGNLTALIPRVKGNLTLIAKVFRQITAGVAYAHSKGVIHRDLTPRNVLIMQDGTLAVSDFGLSCLLDRDSTVLTAIGGKLGTAAYMAPEQNGNAMDAKETADVYALGMMLYQLWTGMPPSRDAILRGEGVNGGLQYLVTKATEVDPTRRYQNVAELVADFDFIVSPASAVEFESSEVTIKRIVETDEPTLETIAELHRLLHMAHENERLHTRYLPKLPSALLELMAEEDVEKLAWIVQQYETFIDGNLDWDYCDVVARFYLRVWLATEHLTTRTTVLTRLLDLGYSHNRYFCRDQFIACLESVRDPALAFAARDVMRAHPRAVKHIEEKLRKADLVPMLRSVVIDLLKEDDASEDYAERNEGWPVSDSSA